MINAHFNYIAIRVEYVMVNDAKSVYRAANPATTPCHQSTKLVTFYGSRS